MRIKNDPTNELLPEIGLPLLRALKILAPHFKRIHEMWRQLMHRLQPDFEAADVDGLACVLPDVHYPSLRAGKALAYRRALARCGQSLDGCGVSPVHVMAALSLYLESCLRILVSLNVHDAGVSMALAHLSSSSQSLVLIGYSKEHSTNWLMIVEKERRRFSQDLHDEIGHNLVVLKLYLELMARDYRRGRKKDVIEDLEEAMVLVSESINAVRRLILDLGPAVLDRLGLLPALVVYADQFSARTGITTEVLGKDVPGIPKAFVMALFRVFQGALANVAKHSKARKVQVTLRAIGKSTLRMTVEDNGVGFDTANRQGNELFGLTAMQERIETLGGRFRLKSLRASSNNRRSGTRIDVDLPLTGVAAPAAA